MGRRLFGLMLALCTVSGCSTWQGRVEESQALAGEGRYEDACAALEDALRIARAAGPQDPRIPDTLDRLGSLALLNGRDSEAQSFYEESLATREQQLGPDALDVTRSLTGLVEVEVWQGRYEDAFELYRRILAIREARLGPDHPMVALTLHNIARALTLQQRYAEAEPPFQRAIAIRTRAFGPDSTQVAESLLGYAELLRFEGRADEAMTFRIRGERILSAHQGPLRVPQTP